MLQHYIRRRESIEKAETILYAVKLKHVFACREIKRRSRVCLQRSGAL